MAESTHASSSSTYGSPRVILKIPDISAGLNHSTISVSDSDPCTPVGIVFKDISKTLTPKNHFVRPVKHVQPSETVMRKVNLMSTEDNIMPVCNAVEIKKDNNIRLKENIVSYTDLNPAGSNSISRTKSCRGPAAENTILTENNMQKCLKDNLIRDSPLTFYSTPDYGTRALYKNALDNSPEENRRFIYPLPNIPCWSDNEIECVGPDKTSPRALQTPSLVTDGNIFNFTNVLPPANTSPFVASSEYRSAEILSPDSQPVSQDVLVVHSQISNNITPAESTPLHNPCYSDISSGDEPNMPDISQIEKGQASKRQCSDFKGSFNSKARGKVKKRRKVSRKKKNVSDHSTSTSSNQLPSIGRKIPSKIQLQGVVPKTNLYQDPSVSADNPKNQIPVYNAYYSTDCAHINRTSNTDLTEVNCGSEFYSPTSYRPILPNSLYTNEDILTACSRLQSNTMAPLTQLMSTYSVQNTQQSVCAAVPGLQPLVIPHMQHAQQLQLATSETGQYILTQCAQSFLQPVTVQNNLLHVLAINALQPNVATPLQNLVSLLPKRDDTLGSPHPCDAIRASTTSSVASVSSPPVLAESHVTLLPNMDSMQGAVQTNDMSKTSTNSKANSLPPPQPSMSETHNDKELNSETDVIIDVGEDDRCLTPPNFRVSPAELEHPNLNLRRIYDIKCLQIGKFKYLQNLEAQFAKLKVNFSKSMLLYELELIRSPEDREQLKCPFGVIEVPFTSVCGLGMLNASTLFIEVNAAPMMYLGYRLCDADGKILQDKHGCYNRRCPSDLTHGQLATTAFHQVTFRATTALKCLLDLAKLRRKFAQLLQQPLTYDREKTIKAPDAAIFNAMDMSAYFKAHLEEIVEQESLKPETDQQAHVCTCSHGCHFSRCGCVTRTALCGHNCRCQRLANCQNPLNTLHNMGFGLAQCYSDPCFINMIYTVKHLSKVLMERVVYPCCGVEVVMSETVPGLKPCPSCGKHSYRYSWCIGRLCDEETERRRHCVRCRRCARPNTYHCRVINRCHPIGFEACPCYEMARESARLDFRSGRIRKSAECASCATTSPNPVRKDECLTPAIRSIPVSTATDKQEEVVVQGAIVPDVPASSEVEKNAAGPLSAKAASAFTPTKPHMVATPITIKADSIAVARNEISQQANDSSIKHEQYLETSCERPVYQPLTSHRYTEELEKQTVTGLKVNSHIKQTSSENIIRKQSTVESANAKGLNECAINADAVPNRCDPLCGGTLEEHIVSDSDSETYFPLIDEEGFPGLTGFNNQVLAQQLDMLPDLPTFTEKSLFDLGKPLHESSPMSKFGSFNQ